MHAAPLLAPERKPRKELRTPLSRKELLLRTPLSPQDGEWRAPQSISTAATRPIAGHFLTNSLQEKHIVVEDALEDLAVEETALRSMTSTANEDGKAMKGIGTS